MAIGRSVAGEIVRRSAPVPTPLRRGAAAAVVTGGALSLAGVAATIPLSADPVPVNAVPAGAAAVPGGTGPVHAGLVAAAAVLPTADPVVAGPDATVAPTLVPVIAEPAPQDAAERLDTAKLVKAVQLAERQSVADRRVRDAVEDLKIGRTDPPGRASESATAAPTTTERAAPAGTAGCDLDTSGLGAVKPHVRKAAQFLGCRYGEPDMFGVAGRAGTSDHPSGKALDFLVNRATGDALANCALRNQEALGITYVIWRQRINFGEGWQPMKDRGGATANHFDHVHVSFGSSAGGPPRGC